MNNWIDLASFTPVSALIGGVMIGVAAVIMIFGIGRILGMSGIADAVFGQIVFGKKPSEQSGFFSWQVVFLLGMITATWLYSLIIGFPDLAINQPIWKVIIAGLLVGFGTRLGSGCTSGHGVCGISRLSARSIVATLFFMVSGIVTASLMGL